jgi:hypothetical protein
VDLKLGAGANPKLKIFVSSFMQIDYFIQNTLGTFRLTGVA